MTEPNSGGLLSGPCSQSGAAARERRRRARSRMHRVLARPQRSLAGSGALAANPLWWMVVRLVVSASLVLRRLRRPALAFASHPAPAKPAAVPGPMPDACPVQERARTTRASFRTSWRIPQTGASFKRKCLMRMTHHHLS